MSTVGGASSGAPATAPTSSNATGQNNVKPKPTEAELRQWNRLAYRMQGFHNHFRHLFKDIYELCDTYEEKDYTTQSFIAYADELHQYLGLHHNIEEEFFFPVLAERMPEFRDEHPAEHREIHEGLDKYEAYLSKCRTEKCDFDAKELKALMETFEQVLFKHLDTEVKSLEYENMSKYWTLAEVNRLRI